VLQARRFSSWLWSVRSVVVHDKVNLEPGGYIGFDGVEKPAKLLGTVAAMELTNHVTGFKLFASC
jgi:hypothetical protein